MQLKGIAVGGGVIATALLLSSFLGLFSHEVDFNTEIKPLINKNCIACHGGVKKAGGFSLLFRHEALAPTKHGKPAIVPGDADASEMIRRLTLTDHDERMPLDAPPLKPEDIDLLRRWIDQGAKWGDHWAYTSIEQPDMPPIGTFWSRLGLTSHPENDWVRNEIDQFVLQKLRDQNLTPAPEADRQTLLRRVSLDLTGLPPTEAQNAAFLADKSPDAYEKVVDRLLASPAYGERWTAMWLDLARYADTKGYESDMGRSIWRYRDWLIKAFNEDKPFDQFTVEQLAGDLLPNPTDDQLVATGFHRNTMTNDEGGTQDEEFRVSAVIDRVNTTWDVWQGTTFACVQCHSHPYDPFVNEDYYKYLAFFNNTRDEDVITDTPTLRFYTKDDSTKVLALQQWLTSRVKHPSKVREVMNFVRINEPKINSHDFDQYVNASLLGARFFGFQDGGSGRIKSVNLTGRNRMIIRWGTRAQGNITLHRDSLTGPVVLATPLPTNGRDTTLLFALPDIAGRHDLYLKLHSPKTPKEWVQIQWISFQPALPDQPRTALGPMDTTLVRLLNSRPESTPILFEGKGDQARKTHVFQRGNWMVKGKEVKPDVPASMPPMAKDLPRNRLGMARWMVSREHPLTARVAVNRFWEQLFGTGLVETVEDFGTQGIQPTHRELLDWLAVEFVETDHWSVKKLLKRLVISATYRQKSEVSPQLQALDPFNKLLARGPRVRLSAEQVRDQALAVSGLLSPKMFGPSVMPPQPDGIWQSPYNGDKWKASEGADRYRRALYTYWKRTSPYPSMITFDSPSREFCQLRRLRTNTPLQALVTLNDPVYMEAARQLAERMQARGRTPEQQLQAGFRLMVRKQLAPADLATLTRLYRTTDQYYRQNPEKAQQLLNCPDATPSLAALTVAANTLLNLDEVITKE